MSPPATTTSDWAAIYTEHGQAMRLAARSAMGGPDKEILGKSSDDVVGDLVAELMVKKRDLSTKDNLRGYLTAAVRNRVRDLQRRSEFEHPEDFTPDDVVSDEDVEAAVDRAELAAQAVAVIDELPERERYAIVEKVMKCRQAKDVGPELGVKPQRVSQLVNAGVGRLRKHAAFTGLLSVDRSLRDLSTTKGPDATGASS
ncbi:sigma-70 family RNA polymerase sigma factor [Iamia majanohamensis]|uniref:Sigma-70 family RNA polymerase sigma factor n=1 Tax=Iamia majanohamensis TaxID=467976 RepID=A0AAF0BS98_9ACTN|nr:sigma-70 family RNA polymerase sigma factor [Iamia majanohamensis]WCO67956.1 sigma-70 family RNA polymerase sigma factor [Iamia majanohamensis]